MRMKLLFLLLLCSGFGFSQQFPPAAASLPAATFASPPAFPALNQAFLFSDASGTGVCSGGGTAFAVCVWNGSAFVASSGAATGLGDPASNSIPFRNSPGSTVPSTATNLSGPNFCADAGSSDTYACDLSPAIAAYVSGTFLWFKANTLNTGPGSVNFNSKGALPLKKILGSITLDIITGDILAGQWVGGFYDGTNFQVATQLGTQVDNSSTQALTNKTVDGVSPTTFGFLDATSSVQTQLNSKANTSSLPTFPAGTIVGTTDVQALTNKTVDGVSPATMGYLDPTSSIQTQLNARQAALIGGALTSNNCFPYRNNSGVLTQFCASDIGSGQVLGVGGSPLQFTGVPNTGGGSSSGGSVTYTTNTTASGSDDKKIVFLNISGGGTYTLAATPPSATWSATVYNGNSTNDATISRNGATINTQNFNITLLPGQRAKIDVDSAGANYLASVPDQLANSLTLICGLTGCTWQVNTNVIPSIATFLQGDNNTVFSTDGTSAYTGCPVSGGATAALKSGFGPVWINVTTSSLTNASLNFCSTGIKAIKLNDGVTDVNTTFVAGTGLFYEIKYDGTVWRLLGSNTIAGAVIGNTSNAILRDVVSVKDAAYGAVGDGTTDDSGALNSAITAVNAAGGGVVNIPTSNYAVNSQITLKSNVRVDLPVGQIRCGTSPSACFKGTSITNAALIGKGPGLTKILLNSGGSSQIGLYLTTSGLGTKYNLVTDAIAGANSFTISSGDFTSLAPVAGDYLWVGDQKGTVRAQVVRVLSAATPTITIDGEFGYSLFVVAGTQVARINSPNSGFTLAHLTIDCQNQTTPKGYQEDFTVYSLMEDVVIQNCAQDSWYAGYGYGNANKTVSAINGGNATGASYFPYYQSNLQETDIRVESRGRTGSFSSNHYQCHFGTVNGFIVDGGNSDGRAFKWLSSTHNSVNNVNTNDGGGATNGISLKLEHSVRHNSFNNINLLNSHQQAVLMSEGTAYNTLNNFNIRFATADGIAQIIDFSRSLNITASYTLTNVGSGVFTIVGAASFANNGGSPNDCDFGNCVGMVLNTSGFTNGVNNTNGKVTAISSDGKTLTIDDGTGATTFITETHSATLTGYDPCDGNIFSNGYIGDSRGAGGSAMMRLTSSDTKISHVHFHEDNVTLAGVGPYANGILWNTAALGNQRTQISGVDFFGIQAGHDIFFNSGVANTQVAAPAYIPDGITLSGNGNFNQLLDVIGLPSQPSCVIGIAGSRLYFSSTNSDAPQNCSQTSNGTYAWSLRPLFGTGSVTFTSISNGACQDQSFTLTGATTSSYVVPRIPATLTAGLNPTIFVSASNAVTVRLCNSSGGSLTPGALTFGAEVRQ